MQFFLEVRTWDSYAQTLQSRPGGVSARPDAKLHGMDWDSVRHFLAIARAGSLKGAARALGVDSSTVSRRLAALESELGARLFERQADGYTCTARGLEVLPLAERMAADFENF